jgi:hypothetical protein
MIYGEHQGDPRVRCLEASLPFNCVEPCWIVDKEYYLMAIRDDGTYIIQKEDGDRLHDVAGAVATAVGAVARLRSARLGDPVPDHPPA